MTEPRPFIGRVHIFVICLCFAGLFIRCSEGIDIFANHGSTDTSGKANSDYSSNKDQLSDRFQKLDAIAESCSEQARRSFKPLLDNTNEVRKVQSALSVLQRVAPLLQVPSLMRQYIEKASFSSGRYFPFSSPCFS